MHIDFQPFSSVNLTQTQQPIVVCVGMDGQLSETAAKVDEINGQIKRLMKADDFKNKAGTAVSLKAPTGLETNELIVLVIDDTTDLKQARKAGSALAKKLKGRSATFMLDGLEQHQDFALELAMAVQLKSYRFDVHKSKVDDEEDKPDENATLTLAVQDPKDLSAKFLAYDAAAQGVFFTRDLVNEPANVLTPQEFADRLAALSDLGVEVTILDEDELARLGFRAMLAVGQGSAQDSKVVIMHWKGEDMPADSRPLALVGKGVVFDTGGISIKPSAKMEEMTMDMGGAGVVSGVMKTLALRKAKANVIGIVGLVENMPDGLAQRPGDIVRALNGTTIEVINTDAEGRLVLADVLTYVQNEFSPKTIIDLATLTGAVIIGLGHHKAGYYANDDQLAQAFQEACDATQEGAWRMPLGEAYDKQLKSRLADIKNVGGRPAGSVTAAMFLKRFIQNDTPWIHIDIAGVTLPPEETELAPKGATGWGVRALDQFIKSNAEF